MLVAVLVSALVSAAEPPPGEPTPAPTEAVEQAAAPSEGPPPSEEPPSPKLLGLQLSVGVPDGLGAGAFVRPLPWLRVDGGVAYNVLAFGIQGGVTLIPWPGRIAPTLRLGAGQYFESDVRDEIGDTFP